LTVVGRVGVAAGERRLPQRLEAKAEPSTAGKYFEQLGRLWRLDMLALIWFFGL
jgi:hypothetical protein